MQDISKRFKKLQNLLETSDHIIIGAGAGLSTAAGIDYGGDRFKNNFQDFIDKYGFTDMYTSGFYPFKTEEEKWAYWARHIYMNNIGMSATDLYKQLLELVKDKDYFVISTNVDDQFLKSGFNPDKVFATQGSYRYLQCAKACHNKLYDATELDKKMLDNTSPDLKIPTELVPKCPVCGGPMELNLRKDNYFVEDEHWHKQSQAYHNYLNDAEDDKTLLLELGVGYNTPSIIRFPFETMTNKFSKWNLARFNRDHLEVVVNEHGEYKLLPVERIDTYNLENNFKERYIPFYEDIESTIRKLLY